MDTTVPPSQAAVAGATTEDKTVAILSYVTILGFIAAMIMHQSHKTQLGAFHLRQMLDLVVTGLVGGIRGVVPILGWEGFLGRGHPRGKTTSTEEGRHAPQVA